MKLVSIIIPNYNGMEHLPVCLDSIEKLTYHSVEVIIVDNASTDDSVKFIKERYPSVSLIELKKNEGFARAVNVGIGHARGDFISLLNNDIEVEPSWLTLMADGLEQHPEVGSIACKMLNYFERDIIDSAGDTLTRTGGAAARGYGQIDRGQFDRPEYVFGACAGAALYRKDIFQSVGTFDEDFFAWFEDIDHSFRSQLLGYKCFYLPAARCYHKRGATGKKMKDRAVQLHVRNQIAYLIKDVPLRIFVKFMPLIVGSRLKNWWIYSRDGLSGAVAKGLVEALRDIPMNIRKRRAIQKAKIVSADYIQTFFTK